MNYSLSKFGLCALYAFATQLLISCSQEQGKIVQTGNPSYRPNRIFYSFENLFSPKFAQLRDEFKIDTVLGNGKGEMEQMLLLRNWIWRIMPLGEGREPPEGDALSYLRAAAQGNHRFVCSQYSVVQHAVMNAYGFQTRTIGAGLGELNGENGHHAANEVWSNTHCKWEVFDAMFDQHFEKAGVPLSALEIRDEFLRNEAADAWRVVGPDRRMFKCQMEKPDTGLDFYKGAATYRWVEWYAYGNSFTGYGENPTILYIYADAYSNSHTWYWDSKRHWAYGTDCLRTISDRNLIEWTPGVLTVKATMRENMFDFRFETSTPNLKEYRIQIGEQKWSQGAASVKLTCSQAQQGIVARTINLANVPGPEYRIWIPSRLLAGR